MSGHTPDALAPAQAYRLLVFDRPIHPDFFDIRASRAVQGDQYQLDLWVARGSHVLLFQSGADCVGEAITPDQSTTPPRGCVESLPFTTERDHEGTFADRIRYITTVQTEIISDNLYRTMLAEMIEFTSEHEILSHRWSDDEARFESGSFVDVQRLAREVHVQTWHLDATCGLIVRSQSIFELLNGVARGRSAADRAIDWRLDSV